MAVRSRSNGSPDSRGAPVPETPDTPRRISFQAPLRSATAQQRSVHASTAGCCRWPTDDRLDWADGPAPAPASAPVEGGADAAGVDGGREEADEAPGRLESEPCCWACR